MKNKKTTIFSQIRNNLVALTSLFIALSSLSYNTWRNEKTEKNRNQRMAGFEIIVKINELQQVIFHHYYDKDTSDKGNLRKAWALVLTIEDLSELLKPPVPHSSQQFKQVWSENYENLSTDKNAVETVLLSIDKMRSDTQLLLKSLR